MKVCACDLTCLFPSVDLLPKEASIWPHASRAETRTSTLNLHFIPETKLTAFSSGDKLLLETSLTQSELSRIASPVFSEEIQPQDHLRDDDVVTVTALFYLNCPYV